MFENQIKKLVEKFSGGSWNTSDMEFDGTTRNIARLLSSKTQYHSRESYENIVQKISHLINENNKNGSEKSLHFLKIAQKLQSSPDLIKKYELLNGDYEDRSGGSTGGLIGHRLLSESGSESESSSSSSSSSSNDIFDGEYHSDAQIGFSICTADNGFSYVTGRTGDAVTNYVYFYGRSTRGGVVKLSAGIYQTVIDAFQFVPDGTGVLRFEATMTKDRKTGKIILESNSFTPLITLTQILGMKGERCLVPYGNWNSASLYPFVVASSICPDGFSNCVDVERYENVLMDDASCFGYFNLEFNRFGGGGNMNNVQIVWDGELRIAEWGGRPALQNESQCIFGTRFQVLTGEKEITVSWRCGATPSNTNIYNGAFYSLCTDAVILDNIQLQNLSCPLFKIKEETEMLSAHLVINQYDHAETRHESRYTFIRFIMLNAMISVISCLSVIALCSVTWYVLLRCGDVKREKYDVIEQEV
eukprot:301484_1